MASAHKDLKEDIVIIYKRMPLSCVQLSNDKQVLRSLASGAASGSADGAASARQMAQPTGEEKK